MSKCFIGFLKIPNGIRFFHLSVYVFIARHRNTIDFCRNFVYPETLMSELTFVLEDIRVHSSGFSRWTTKQWDSSLRTPAGTPSPALDESADSRLSAPTAPTSAGTACVTPKSVAAVGFPAEASALGPERPERP